MLSRYLFILCVEGLSDLIMRAESRGDINSVKIYKNTPILSHLLFASDCFLFFRATEDVFACDFGKQGLVLIITSENELEISRSLCKGFYRKRV
jgi:hypothetical protein